MKKILTVFLGAFLLFFLYFNLFLIPADLQKGVFDKPVFSDTTENFSVSKIIWYTSTRFLKGSINRIESCLVIKTPPERRKAHSAERITNKSS